MKEIINAALNEAESKKIKNLEVRITRYIEESIHLKNGAADAIGEEESIALGIRSYSNNGQSYISSNIVTKAEAARLVRKAYRLAREQESFRKIQSGNINLSKHIDDRSSSYEIDPFSISIEEKISLLGKAQKRALKVDRVILSTGSVISYKRESWYANSAGANIHQTLTSCGAQIQVYSLKQDELQVRTYPARNCSFAQKGFEHIKSMNFLENSQKTAEEAVALTDAPPCPRMDTTVVISSDQMALQIHESVGHPTELDRVLGHEISLAGASYLDSSDLNKRKIANKKVTIISDATQKYGNGSFYYDDEGVKAQRFPIVKNGILTNFQTSRDTAIAIGKRSNGCARADTAHRIPLVRMSNISLTPGEGTLEDLLSDVSEGIYLETTKSWSIDDLRLNFQFAVEMAREIKNGKLGKIYRNANYTGISPEFWKSLVACGGKETFKNWGFATCGKGDPMQVIPVGHGAPVAKFRNVKVGASK